MIGYFDGAAEGLISDRSGTRVPRDSATTAEIEFCGEPLMNRSVHTTYTKVLCEPSQNRMTCNRLNSIERCSVKASSPFSNDSFTLIGPIWRTATEASDVSSSANPRAPLIPPFLRFLSAKARIVSACRQLSLLLFCGRIASRPRSLSLLGLRGAAARYLQIGQLCIFMEDVMSSGGLG
jgi:hypothetical protein